MVEFIKTGLFYLASNLQDIFVYTVVMVSAIIVAIGLLKPVVFNKIKSKQWRKVALSFSNVGACFISALVLFCIKSWNFKYYLAFAIALTISCIVTYWLYENTCLRNLIETIGKIALRKFGNVAFLAVTTDEMEEIKNEAKKATAEIKAMTKDAIQQTATQMKEDKDSENPQ